MPNEILFKCIDITADYVADGESLIVNRLFKLELDGKCFFDDFLETSPKKIQNKTKTIAELDAILTLIIEGSPTTRNKVRPLSGSNEWEIRIKRTRLYFFIDPPSKNIVVLGHYNKKNDDQQEFIDKFQSIKESFLKRKK